MKYFDVTKHLKKVEFKYKGIKQRDANIRNSECRNSIDKACEEYDN